MLTLSVITYLSILAVAIYLFVSEKIAIEIAGLIIVVLLIFSGTITKEVAFSSFGNDSIFLIASLYVMTAGLSKTGLLSKLEHVIVARGQQKPQKTFFIILALAGIISSFISNAATMAAILPIVISIAHKLNIPARNWLLPTSFIAVLAGTNTLIGSSTNMVISSLLPRYGLDPLGLFTLTPISLPIFFIGIIYLLFFSRFLVSSNTDTEQSLDLKYDLRSYTAEVRVLENSPLCGTQIENSALFRQIDVTIIAVSRKDYPVMAPRGGLMIRANDKLIVEGNIKKLTEIRDVYGLKFPEELKALVTETGEQVKLDNLKFHEVLVSSKSILASCTPLEVQLRNRYKISLIAINRHGTTLREKLKDVKIASGDILIVQFLSNIQKQDLDYLGLVPLQSIETEVFRVKFAKHAGIIFLASILIGSFTNIAMSLSCLAGALAMVSLGIVRAHEAFENIDWKILIFIGSVICLGLGMENSGSALAIANLLKPLLVTMRPELLIFCFFAISATLTQLLSNQATGVILIPIAVNMSQLLQIDPMPLIIALTMGASSGYLTPLDPPFMLVYGPGGYKFKDFAKVGFFLLLISGAMVTWLVPLIWKF